MGLFILLPTLDLGFRVLRTSGEMPAGLRREQKAMYLKDRNCEGLPKRKSHSKNRRMPLLAASTRYSLVKGERIVRSVLTARLRACKSISRGLL
ncbi:Mitochondrial chaperone BCS1 [Senna tora]|uniref:Mitochondrial chaperone BCS1 n=1 Tax=Senna tora TaxID=362788 RepID=A0A834SJQ4_9FABA|nr:Mitochondrial chaperone BCS1 [Senna tora]